MFSTILEKKNNKTYHDQLPNATLDADCDRLSSVPLYNAVLSNNHWNIPKGGIIVLTSRYSKLCWTAGVAVPACL